MTLHMMIHSKREEISDVPAVYFVRPTEKNLKRIAEDCKNDLYSSFYLNFSSPLPRPMLERLAMTTLRDGKAAKIAKIVDQYLPFLCLERDLFTLNLDRTFQSYVDPTASDKSVESKMDEIASGLFAIMATMKHVPVIQCPKGGAAEAVGRRLVTMIRRNMASADSIFEGSEQLGGLASSLRVRGHDARLTLNSDARTGAQGGGRSASSKDGNDLNEDEDDLTSRAMLKENERLKKTAMLGRPAASVFGAQRPLLLIAERSSDFVSTMRHSIAYQDLVHDLLQCSLNRVTYKNTESGRMESCTLDAQTDMFWRRHAGDEFHIVVKQNNVDLQRTKAKISKLQAMTTSSGAQSEMQSEELSNAVEELPRLVRKKKQLERHTTILEAIMNAIDARHIHEFYKAEESVLSKPDTKPEELDALMSKGHVEDRLRLLCVCAAVGAVKERDLDDALRSLKASLRSSHDASGGDVSSTFSSSSPSENGLEHVALAEGVVSFLKQRQRESSITGSGSPTNRTRKKTSSSRGVLGTLWAKGVAEISQRLGGNHKKRSMIEQLLDVCVKPPSSSSSNGSSSFEQMRRNLLNFDPRQDPDADRSPRRRAPTFNSAVVFVIGGGHTSELHALRRWETTGDMNRSVVYGCTELTNASALLSQIASVARK